MPKVRPVRKVIRKVDVASVVRLSLVFWIAVTTSLLLAGAMIWTAAGLLGVFVSMSKFMESIGVVHFRVHGGAILRASVALAVVFVAGATVFTGLLAILYNAASGLVGGVEFFVAEPAGAEQPASAVVTAIGSAVVRSSVDEQPAVVS